MKDKNKDRDEDWDGEEETKEDKDNENLNVGKYDEDDEFELMSPSDAPESGKSIRKAGKKLAANMQAYLMSMRKKG